MKSDDEIIKILIVEHTDWWGINFNTINPTDFSTKKEEELHIAEIGAIKEDLKKLNFYGYTYENDPLYLFLVDAGYFDEEKSVLSEFKKLIPCWWECNLSIEELDGKYSTEKEKTIAKTIKEKYDIDHIFITHAD